MTDPVIQVDPADCFNHSRLYGNEKYKLSNMLIRQVKFPASAKRSELGSVWTDRIYAATEKAYKEVVEPSSSQGGGGDACVWFRSCSEEEFLRYAQVILSEGCYKNSDKVPTVTGARMIRYTNVSSGYPAYCWNFYYGGKHTPEAPVNYPQPKMGMDGYVYCYDGRRYDKYR
jgi:hypothetical protein